MILIIDLNKEPLSRGEFVAPIEQIVKSGFITKKIDNLTNEDILTADKIIFSGTPIQDDYFIEKLDKFNVLRDFNRPVLGVCAGMQLINLVFGGKNVKKKEIGMIDIATKRENPLFSGDFKAYCVHRNAVAKNTQFHTLAKSKRCIEAIKHKDKPIYGVLFHPEVRNPEVLLNFLRLP